MDYKDIQFKYHFVQTLEPKKQDRVKSLAGTETICVLNLDGLQNVRIDYENFDITKREINLGNGWKEIV